MLLLFAASIAVSAPDSAPRATVPEVQSRAKIRILSGVRIRFDGERGANVPKPRQAQIQTIHGLRPAQLIEFE